MNSNSSDRSSQPGDSVDTTAPKLPEGLEPVAWRPDLEALMPEPSVRAVYADAHNTPAVKHGFEMSGWLKSPDYYTATQMREAILAATERAAKVCDGLVYALDNGGNRYRREADASKCAAAIRGASGQEGGGAI